MTSKAAKTKSPRRTPRTIGIIRNYRNYGSNGTYAIAPIILIAPIFPIIPIIPITPMILIAPMILMIPIED